MPLGSFSMVSWGVSGKMLAICRRKSNVRGGSMSVFVAETFKRLTQIKTTHTNKQSL